MPPTFPPAQAETAFYKRTWFIATVIGMLALLVGFLIGESSGKAQEQSELDQAWLENYDLQDRLEEKEREVFRLQQQLDGDAASSNPENSFELDPFSDPYDLEPFFDPYDLDPFFDPDDQDPWFGFWGKDVSTSGFSGNGVYLIGFDIEAGVYQSEGNEGCSWIRIPGSDDSDPVIGSSNTATEVSIEPSDFVFVSEECADWTRVR